MSIVNREVEIVRTEQRVVGFWKCDRCTIEADGDTGKLENWRQLRRLPPMSSHVNGETDGDFCSLTCLHAYVREQLFASEYCDGQENKVTRTAT